MASDDHSGAGSPAPSSIGELDVDEQEKTVTEADNPYLGHTLGIVRPSMRDAQFRSLEEADLVAAQAQWDAAEQARLEASAREIARHEMLMREETHEEPASKALENRMRIAFLSTKGATMQVWLKQRDAVMADLIPAPGRGKYSGS
jgi:hypothetical protein